MNRTGTVVLVVVLLIAAVAGIVFLVGGPGAILGTETNVDGGKAATPPEKAGAGAGTGDAARAPESTKPGDAVLFGRPKAERKGVGTLSVRALRWKGEAPVAGAAVSLRGVGNGDERVERSEKTSVQGKASFADVPAGDGYLLRVEAAGEPPTVLPGVDVEAGKSRDIVVYVGQKSALSGRVVDEEGKPVAGADVRAFSGYEGLFDMMANFVDMLGSLDREPVPLAKAESDAKGEFTIPDLSPGPLVLRANAPGKRQAILQVKLSPEGPAGGPPTIVLEAGVSASGVVVDTSGAPVAGARVSLMPEDSSDPTNAFLGRTFTVTDDRGAFRVRVGDDVKRLRAFVAATGYPTTLSKSFRPGEEDVRIVLSGGATLEISVVEADGGRPISGASVMLGISAAENDPQMNAGGAMVTVTTDDRGSAVSQVPPGVIEMAIVSAPGHAGGMVNPGSPGANAGNPFGTVQHDLPPRLEAGKTSRATFKLVGGWTMKGRVADPAGNGIADAEVKAAGMMGMGGPPVSTRSDAQGRYRLSGVTSMAMIVTVRAPGWVQREADRIAFMASRFGGAPGGKKVEPPQPGSEVEQNFTLIAAVTVRGSVVDDKGGPVAGATVSLADGGMGLQMLFGGKDAEVTTSADGSYVLSDVDASSGGGPMAMMAALAPAMAGEPAADPAPAGPVKGKLTVSARADGFVRGKSETFEVEAGATVTAPTIRLGRGASLVGHVRDAGGGAISGAKVEVARDPAEADPMQTFRDAMTGGKAQTLRTGADGSFRLDTLPKGTVTITAAAEGHAAARRTVKIEDDGSKPDSPKLSVELRLPPAQTLSGRVVDRDGRPVAKARVSVTGPESDDESAYVAPRDGTTKEDGTFSLSPLPPGRVKVTVRATGKKPTELVLATGGTAPDVVLEDRPASEAGRLAEVKKELAEVQKKFVDAKSADERTALQQRMIELMQEQTALEGGKGGSEDDGGDK